MTDFQAYRPADVAASEGLFQYRRLNTGEPRCSFNPAVPPAFEVVYRYYNDKTELFRTISITTVFERADAELLCNELNDKLATLDEAD